MKVLFKSILALFCSVPFHLFAAQQASTLFNLMEREGILVVELELSLSTLEENQKTLEEYPGVLRFTDNRGNLQEWEVEVRARGRYRRRICVFPPLKIDFSKSELESKGLMPYDDLKLVTHCMEDGKGEETLLREYVAYQLYGIVATRYFRTQLVEITYIDSDTGNRLTEYGFILEDTDEMAARFNSEEEEVYGLGQAQVDPESYHTNALFQYMVGNADWSLEMGRNLKIMRPEDGGKHWLAPYDFDFSGLADAAYAVPKEEVGQMTVRQRVYLGSEESLNSLQPAIRVFRARKEDMLGLISGFKLLNRRARKDMARYLESFFVELEEGNFPSKGETNSSRPAATGNF